MALGAEVPASSSAGDDDALTMRCQALSGIANSDPRCHSNAVFRPSSCQICACVGPVHCADSEGNAALRIRFLLTEDATRIQAYDQAHWAKELDYHTLPIEPALARKTTIGATSAGSVMRASAISFMA